MTRTPPASPRARSGGRRRGTRRARARVCSRERPRARAPRSRRPRCAGCARPARRARTSTGSSSSPRTTRPAGRRASASRSSTTSAREPNVVWWSRSTFVITAMSGRSDATVRSDSSPSRTNQPSPARALTPSCGISPPIANEGSSPSRSRTNAIIAAVVVFPCAPVTTIVVASADELGEELGPGRALHARIRRRDDRLVARRRDRRLVGRSRPHRRASGREVRRLLAVPARRPRRPSRARRARTPRAPRRRCPRTRASDPQAASASTSSAITSAASGRASARIASPIAASRSRVGEQLLHLAPQVELLLGHDDGAAALLEEARVLRLVVAGRVGIRDEQRGLAGGGDLPDRPARARDARSAAASAAPKSSVKPSST